MKKFVYSVFVLLIVFSFSSIAQAQEKQYDSLGIYVGLIGGYPIPSNMGTSYTVSGVQTVTADTALNDGYLYGAKVGWLTPFTKRIMAVEFEYNRISNSMNKLENISTYPLPVNIDMTGNVKMDMFMVNLMARYPQGKFHPYIGAGAGYALVKVDDSTIYLIPLGGMTGVITGGSTGVFAYQVMAGIDYDITKNIIIGLSYKYMATPSFNFNNTVQGTPATTSMSYGAHNILLSLSYLF